MENRPAPRLVAATLATSLFFIPSLGRTASAPVWEPDYTALERACDQGRQPAETVFLEAARTFLSHEGFDSQVVSVDLRSVADPLHDPSGRWRAMADVYVNRHGSG